GRTERVAGPTIETARAHRCGETRGRKGRAKVGRKPAVRRRGTVARSHAGESGPGLEKSQERMGGRTKTVAGPTIETARAHRRDETRGRKGGQKTDGKPHHSDRGSVARDHAAKEFSRTAT